MVEQAPVYKLPVTPDGKLQDSVSGVAVTAKLLTLKAADWLSEVESYTETTKLTVVANTGVPEMTPVFELRYKPSGRAPAVRRYDNEPSPPIPMHEPI